MSDAPSAMYVSDITLTNLGSKKAVAAAFLKACDGNCTVNDYKSFIKSDETWEGSKRGCEWYAAVREWRQERGLCDLNELNTYSGEAQYANAGLEKDDVREDVDYGISAVLPAKEEDDAKEPEEAEDVKEPEEKETSKWDLIKNIFQTAEEVILEKKDGKLHLSLSFGMD